MSDADALAALPPLRELIRRHGLRARRSLGQNFLLDLNLTARIARAAGDLKGCTVLEVGPGPGGLTRQLLASGAARVVAVEADERCLAILAELAALFPDRLTIVAADALTVEPRELVPQGSRIVANLPFNIATPLLLKWLPLDDHLAGMCLLFQKEVAQRLAAAPGGKSYGRLSVVTQWRWQARARFEIPPRAFVPPPKVTATLVALTPRAAPQAPAPSWALEAVTKAAFGQRRKMLRSSLKELVEEPGPLLAAAGLDGARRAEEVDVRGFCALARAYAEGRA